MSLRHGSSDDEGHKGRARVSLLTWVWFLVLIPSALAVCLSGLVDHVIREL